MLNYPDPFEHPNAYWRLTMSDDRLNHFEKVKILKAAGLKIDEEPKPSGEEIRLKRGVA